MFLNMDHGQKFGKSLHSLMGICGFSPSQGPFFQFPSSSTPWYSFQQGQETLPLIGHSLGGAVHQGVPSFLGEKMVAWPTAGQSDDCSRELESRGHTQGLKIVEDGSSTGGLWKLTSLFFDFFSIQDMVGSMKYLWTSSLFFHRLGGSNSFLLLESKELPLCKGFGVNPTLTLLISACVTGKLLNFSKFQVPLL